MTENRICAVSGCNNIRYYVYKDRESSTRRFHRFPKSPTMCSKWIEILRRYDLYPILEEQGAVELWRRYRICSDHFNKSDYVIAKKKGKGLKLLAEGAIPSQNLDNENVIFLPEVQIKEEYNEEEHQTKGEEEANVHNEIKDLEPEVKPQIVEQPEEIPKPQEETVLRNNQENTDKIIIYSILSEVDTVAQQPPPPPGPKKKRKTAMEIIRELKDSLALSKEVIRKFELERSFLQTNFDELDKVKNEYIDFHAKLQCKGNDDCQKDFALELYMKSPQIYKHLQQKFHLPHTLMLYKWKLRKEQLMRKEQLNKRLNDLQE